MIYSCSYHSTLSEQKRICPSCGLTYNESG